jgi:peptidoglycan hydrolase-like protein with peptidoglycan-binding domain
MVRRAQYACQLITGAPATVDGDFGGQTDEAIRNFQRFFGLKDDGQVGPKTWAVLEQITND